jgi:hypothetical protein
MKNIFRKKLHLWAAGLVFVLLCMGCAKVKEITHIGKEEKTSYYMHAVQWPGETVSIIAGWYTGDIENWKALVNANPDINPNLIVKGNKIRIPENLLKKKDPMPKNYVESFYQKHKEKVPAVEASPPSPEKEGPELFGPK